jgi:hypothetical protein
MATLDQIGAALKAADAAGNTEDARRLAQAYAQMRDTQGPAMAPNALPTVTVRPTQEEIDATQPRRFAQDLGRAAIMTGRNVVHGALALPAMLNDATLVPAINAVSKAVGSDYREAPSSQQLDSYMNAVGIPNPQPENATERVVSGIDRGVGGLLSGAGIGRALAGAGNQALQGVGEALTSNLGAQTAATAGGSAGSEITRELGGSPLTQIGFGLAGGVSPAALGAGRQAITSGAARLLSSPSDEAVALGRYATDAGIPLKASQVSPSKAAKLVDSVTGQVPFSGAQAFQQTQQRAFNRAVARTIGEDADAITPEVFSAARARIGASYDDLASRINPQITPAVQTKLANVLKSAQQFGSDDSARAVASAIDRVKAQMADGVMPGKAYKSLDSELGNITKNGGEKGMYAGQVREILRDAFTKSASPADKAQMALANRQYANLKTIEPLVASDAVEGNISPAKLLGRVTANKAGKASMASGSRGELGMLANAGQRFLKAQIPDSGTAQRSAVVNALKTVGTLGTGVAAGSGMVGIPAAVMTAIGAVGGSRAIQAAMKNPALVKALLGQKSPSEIGRLLMISANPTAQQVIQQ